MKQAVMLRIVGRQAYDDQEPDSVELMTEGSLEFRDGGWNISYEETDLTGLSGVTTTFRVEPNRVTLTRTGQLRSVMVFQVGVSHDSLYQMEFGALLMRTTARQVVFEISSDGGFIDLVYDIEIENSQAGVVDYHLEIRPAT